MSHTPTPWGQYGRLVLDTPESVGGYYIVRQMLPSQPGKTPRPAGYDVVAFVRSPEDADLIAAAPNMLAALEAVADHHDNGGTLDRWLAIIATCKAAIAEAKETKPCS